MKVKFFLSVAIAALTLAGCAKENSGKTDAYDLTIRIKKPVVSRTVSDDVNGASIAISSGYLVFTEKTAVGNKITRVVKINASGTEDDDNVNISTLQTAVGATIKEIPSASTTAHVIANYGSDFTPAFAVNTYLTDYPYNYAVASQWDSSGGVANVAIYGEETMSKISDGSGGHKFKVTVAVSAVASRLQIGGFRLKTNNVIASYSVEGIYVNNYFAGMPYYMVYGSGAATTNFGDDHTAYPGTIPSALYDEGTGGMGTASAEYVEAGTDKYWAYNVLPNVDLTRSELPHILVKLNFTLVDNSTEIRWLTVTGYTSGSDSLEELAPGYAYTVKNASGYFDFDYEDTDPLPEQGTITGEVIVDYIDWVTVAVEPELN